MDRNRSSCRNSFAFRWKGISITLQITVASLGWTAGLPIEKNFAPRPRPPPKKSAPAHLRGGRGSLGRGYFVDALIECPGRGMGGELSETISQDSRSAREFHGPGTPSGPRLSSPRKSHREAPVLRPRSPPKKAPRLARSKPGFPGKGILFLCTGEWFLAGLCVEVFRGKEEKISDHQFGSGGPRRRIRAESPEALSALAFRTGFPYWLSVLAAP